MQAQKEKNVFLEKREFMHSLGYFVMMGKKRNIYHGANRFNNFTCWICFVMQMAKNV